MTMPGGKRAVAAILVATCLVTMVWAAGFYALKHRWPFSAEPASQIAQTLAAPPGPAQQGTHDGFFRLTAFPGKREIRCPVQTPKTLVLLLAGQSNAANHAEKGYASSYGDRIVNYFGGKCFRAASPLLGATGEGGESWTLLGNKLIASGVADQVVLIPAAIGGTAISRWQAGGDLNGMLLSVVDDARLHYRITHVLWHQGESDYFEKTSHEEYTTRFFSLLDSLRQHGVDAPVFPSVTTRCLKGPEWFPVNPTAQAQHTLPDRSRGVYAGIDTDSLLELEDRDVTCHYRESGQEKFAGGWLEILWSHRP